MTAEQHATFSRPAKLRIEDFSLLDRAGSFAGHKKVELIDGTIFVVNAAFTRHAWATKIMLRRIDDALERVGSAYMALSEASVSMPPHDLPQPDVVVTSASIGQTYVPLASVALIVEVADSSVDDDLGGKARLYAAHAVPEYWVVDLPARLLHQHWSPRAEGYRERASTPLGEPITSISLPELAISTERVLPS